MNKNQKFLIGTVGALLTGVAIGLLVAPKKGKDTRKLIKSKANDIGSTVKTKASDLGGTAKDTYEKSLEELSTLADRLKEGFLKNVNAVKGKAETVADNVNEKVRSTVHNG
ncbi:YtxH domain-containing protein [Dyadobacter sp. LHD-138]|uniref:YtxH domain-containing protein n=1 Tax=Dyadobacter sp. LHD-138 TaxID=3071413 RepID=UPI0027DEC732|nr:YtxH domain-containing protein [Dyadobacter sp. LHD-138]MDQ6477585.1 YtxH domain-containing protein [Dyadobacter sp. LHD-138]